MIPKVKFEYSWPYDAFWKDYAKKYPNKMVGNKSSYKEIRKYIKKIEKIWEKEGKKILKEISNTTGLKWKNKKITCYIVGDCVPFSDPLTMPIISTTKYPNWFIDTLTHELIHRLIARDNNFNEHELIDKVYKKYRKENINTRNHILIHAIHKEIYLKLFGKERLERNIRVMQFLQPYRRSWQIVEKEGHENIIEKIRKLNK